MAKAINSLPLIKKLWSTVIKDEYTIYHKLLSLNYHNFKPGILEGTPVITPSTDFPVLNPSIEIINNTFIITLPPFSSDSFLNFIAEPYIIPVALFMIDSPDKKRFPITLMSRTGIKQNLDSEKYLTLSINLAEMPPVLPDGRTLLKSWTVLITLDEQSNPIHFSDLIPWPV